MKINYNQHIGIFEDAVPFEFCNKIIEIYENNPTLQYDRKYAEGITDKTRKNDHHLESGAIPKDMIDIFQKNFYKNVLREYSNNYTINLDQYPHAIIDFKVQKTLPTEGYHVWHYENEGRDSRRFAVYTLYLNDVEEGGETEFLHQSLRIKPKKGTIVIFPAGYTHLHRGNPPLSGEKYIVTGWISWIDPDLKPQQ
jgi:hypothetical protein